MSNEKDFSVRNLSEYPVIELQKLYNLVVLCHSIDNDDVYDLWAYRIRDAIKEAKKK